MNHHEKLAFITTTAPDLFKNLTVNSQARWGKMNAHQMIEHMTESVGIASGSIPKSLVTSVENLPKLKAFLLSDTLFKENTKNSQMGEFPEPAKTSDINAALVELQMELNKFTTLFAQHPETIIMNPIFGPLNFEEWTQLLYKHFLHHCKQFNLI